MLTASHNIFAGAFKYPSSLIIKNHLRFIKEIVKMNQHISILNKNDCVGRWFVAFGNVAGGSKIKGDPVIGAS